MNILYTERLMLRSFVETDRQALLAILSDPETVRYMYHFGRPGVTPEEDTDRFLFEHAIPEWKREPIRMREYAIIHSGTGELIGDVSLEILEEHKAEIGWILKKEYRHQGYVTEAGKCLLQFGFETLGIHKIIACCDERNVSSVQVMRRLGMIQISRTPCARPVKKDGIAGDEVVYGIDKAAWWWKKCGSDNYVRTARSKIGHDLLVFAGACVFVCQNGKMLLQRRRDDGKWSNHGGCVEPGENIENAVRRELLEETGLKAVKLIPVGTYSGDMQFHTYPNGDMAWIIDHVFLCVDFEGELTKQESEVVALEWFPINALPPQEEWEESIYRMVKDCIRILNTL